MSRKKIPGNSPLIQPPDNRGTILTLSAKGRSEIINSTTSDGKGINYVHLPAALNRNRPHQSRRPSGQGERKAESSDDGLRRGDDGMAAGEGESPSCPIHRPCCDPYTSS